MTARVLAPLFAVATLLLAGPARAVLPQEQLADPALEARARAISRELRCVVCQNQSIDDSDASLAADLRVLLRERLSAGDSDDQAKAFLVERYGSYVLLKPPLSGETLLLWLGPLLVLVLGGAGVALYLRGRIQERAEDFSPAEQDRLKTLLGTDETA